MLYPTFIAHEGLIARAVKLVISDTLIAHFTFFIIYALNAFYAALLPIGGGRILRRTLSVCPSVRPSRYRCHWLRLFGPASVTSRHLANYNDTHVLFGTH